jgi:hypothetical protein
MVHVDAGSVAAVIATAVAGAGLAASVAGQAGSVVTPDLPPREPVAPG